MQNKRDEKHFWFVHIQLLGLFCAAVFCINSREGKGKGNSDFGPMNKSVFVRVQMETVGKYS